MRHAMIGCNRSRPFDQSFSSEGTGWPLRLASIDWYRNLKKLRPCLPQVAMAVYIRSGDPRMALSCCKLFHVQRLRSSRRNSFLGFCINLYGLGLRLTTRGSRRPGRLATSHSAICSSSFRQWFSLCVLDVRRAADENLPAACPGWLDGDIVFG